MNRTRHQGQSGRQGMHAQQPKRIPTGQQFSNSGENVDWDQNYEKSQPRAHSKNFSGNSSWMAEDQAQPSQSYRDTDYDLDSSTYGGQSQMDASTEKPGYFSNTHTWPGADRWYSPPGSSTHNQSYEGNLAGQDWGKSQQGFLGKGPKGYKRSDDRIKEDVCETLLRDRRIDASDIEVNVKDAMVTLSGTVDNREAKRAAEMVIENLSGVDDVRNDLKVKKSNDMQTSSTSESSKPAGKTNKY